MKKPRKPRRWAVPLGTVAGIERSQRHLEAYAFRVRSGGGYRVLKKAIRD